MSDNSTNFNFNFNFNFNNDGEQRSFDVIPDNTVCTVQMTIRPGGAGQDRWLTRAKNGNSAHLDCEFVVVDGPYAKRKLWNRYTVTGTNHAEAIDISRRTLRAILESARGINPKDKSDTAERARGVQGFQDFDQLRFMVRLGVEPPTNGYAANNTIKEVITPERREWKKVDQIERDLIGRPTTAASSEPAATSANAIKRPDWA